MPKCRNVTNDSTLQNRFPSFNISITDFVKFFNRSHGVIIKNLPNKMLSEEQVKIKKELRAVTLPRSRLQQKF